MELGEKTKSILVSVGNLLETAGKAIKDTATDGKADFDDAQHALPLLSAVKGLFVAITSKPKSV